MWLRTSTVPWINLVTNTIIGLYFMKKARIKKQIPLNKIDPPNILKYIVVNLISPLKRAWSVIWTVWFGWNWLHVSGEENFRYFPNATCLCIISSYYMDVFYNILPIISLPFMNVYTILRALGKLVNMIIWHPICVKFLDCELKFGHIFVWIGGILYFFYFVLTEDFKRFFSCQNLDAHLCLLCGRETDGQVSPG